MPLWPRLGRSTPGERDPLGPAAERAAARFLRKRGYRVLGRNVRVGVGEADLVCEAPDRRAVVIVEVKARRLRADADTARQARIPEAAITGAKQAKLVAIARSIAMQRRWSDRPLRIDVVAVDWPDRGRPQIRHHEDAVRA